MHDSPHHENDLQNPEVAYERSDASMRGVLAFIFVLAIVGIFVHLLLWGLYRYLASEARAADPAPNPLAYDLAPEPPQPRLQKAPVAEMNTMRLDEIERLNSYGWMDKSAGTTHIPIDRAMDLLVRRGLPTRVGAGLGPAASAPKAPRANKESSTVKR